MLKVRLFALAIVIVALMLAVGAFFLPVPPQLNKEEAVSLSVSLAFLTFLQVIALGITGLFLIGLKGFKTEFKRAYYFICLGQIVGITPSVIIYSGVYVGSYTNPDTEVIATIIGFMIAVVSASFIVMGIRYFARLLQIKPWAVSLRTILPSLAIVMVGIWFLPRSQASLGSEQLFYAQVMFMAAYVVLTLLLGVAVLQIRQATGVRYHRALGWFAAYLLFVGVAGINSITLLFIGDNPTLQLVVFVLYIVSTLTLMNAGISFNKITRQIEKFKLNSKSAIDLLTYMASYASNPRDIDIILDEMRAMTALEQGTAALDEKKLVHIYQGLEDYLTTKERLRVFTKDSLRAMLRERFDASLVDMFTNRQ